MKPARARSDAVQSISVMSFPARVAKLNGSTGANVARACPPSLRRLPQ